VAAERRAAEVASRAAAAAAAGAAAARRARAEAARRRGAAREGAEAREERGGGAERSWELSSTRAGGHGEGRLVDEHDVRLQELLEAFQKWKSRQAGAAAVRFGLLDVSRADRADPQLW